jgi:hypothetical protein
MNCCRETVKMGVPPGNRPALPRDWTRGVPERYVAGELVLPVPSVVAGSLSKEHPRTHGRTPISSVAASDS